MTVGTLNERLENADSDESQASLLSHRPDADRPEDGTPKHLTLLSATSINIGHVIGAGIFASSGMIIKDTGSIGMCLVVWLLVGLASWAQAACIAELGSALPYNGGHQAYIKHIYGQLMAFMWSWASLVLSTGPAALCLVVGEYMLKMAKSLLNPASVAEHSTEMSIRDSVLIKTLGVMILVIVAFINCYALSTTTHTAVVLTTLKMLALVLISILAVAALAKGQVSPDIAVNLFSGSHTSIGPYAEAAYAAIWAYSGLDSIAFATGEMKNIRTLSRSLHFSSASIIMLYLAVNLSYFAVLPKDVVAQSNSIALDFGLHVLGPMGALLFSAIVIASAVGSVNSVVFLHARVIVKVSRDGHFLSYFSYLHPERQTPVRAVIFYTIHTSLFVVAGDLAFLVTFGGIVMTTFTFMVTIGLFFLRRRDPDLNRPYKAPLVAPVVSGLQSLWLMFVPLYSNPKASFSAVIFMLCGLPIYYYIERKRRQQGDALDTSRDDSLEMQQTANAGRDEGTSAIKARGHVYENVPLDDDVEKSEDTDN